MMKDNNSINGQIPELFKHIEDDLEGGYKKKVTKNSKNKIINNENKLDKKVKKETEISKFVNINNNEEIINEEIRPIKVIYKCKNNNRKDIYWTYIYIGALGKKCEKIFKKIEDLDLFSTLMTLQIDEEIKIKKLLGNDWINKLFNRHHILSSIKKINSSKDLSDKIKAKYGIIWMDEFKEQFVSKILFKKMNYSYGEYIKNEYMEKMGKKIEKLIIDKEDYDMEYNKGETENLLNEINKIQVGGNEYNMWGGATGENSTNIESDDDDDDNTNNISFMSESEDSIEVITNNETEELTDEDILELYKTDEKDENIKKTNAMIANIFKNTKIIEHKADYMIKYDTSKDNDIDNDNLVNVFKKKFIYTHYIFDDDNIKTVKNKICSTIEVNKKFSDDLHLSPSRIYLWTEYLIGESNKIDLDIEIDRKLEKVMLGQRWIKKNDLLKINIEPYNLLEYENMSDNVKKIKNILDKNESKIKREDEETNILNDYNEFMLNDTIYMIDIYNELGKNYDANDDQIKNVNEIFMKLYFPKIRSDEFRELILFLNKKDNSEEKQTNDIFNTTYNDILLENEVTDIVENVRVNEVEGCEKIFAEKNYITQSSIHVSLKITDEYIEEENRETIEKVGKLVENTGGLLIPKLDLFRIFNNFELDDKYPFIQYQVPNGQIIFKYLDDYMYEFSKTKENVEILTKWFENSPYGISFKVKYYNDYIDNDGKKITVERFMAININEIGKVIYKTHHKEEYNTSISDVENTYDYVRDLVRKINKILDGDIRKMSIKVPKNYEFKFDFINSNQKFKFPKDKIINHNDLSDFCVFFYPYISLVIEPKKRIGKIESKNEKSKYGTYLRYKRVSKYENQGKIEQRILSYIRNFDFEDDILVEEISKQFNITDDRAKEEISKVRKKFPNMNRGKKTQLSKTTEIPKFKPSGIGIDIQGKTPDKYKIKISGARNECQLLRIIKFINILLFLYAEVYLLKNPKYFEIKDKLKKITNIAKRRNKVDEVVNYEKDSKKLKEMISLDKKRLGYLAEDKNLQWARLCQNSGTKKKRPILTLSSDVTKLTSSGYNLNKKTGDYEKKILFKQKGKNNEVILKALKVPSENANDDIYYSCDPDENGEYMYVGFLTKTVNPFGQCMPCCYKKNPFTSKQKEKVLFNEKCLSSNKNNKNDDKNNKDEKSKKIINNEILYILQDSNKTGENRISYLPNELNMITNYNLNRTNEIRNHYLLKTDGYFFRYGINIENYSFINTLSNILDLSINEIKNKIINLLKNDTDEMLYYSLNDGDIRYEFRINDFITFLNTNEEIDLYYLNDLMKQPGLFTENGIYCIVFDKNAINNEFYLDIDNYIISDFNLNLEMIDNKDILIMLKEKKFYFPIVEIIKKNDIEKDINVKKTFNKSNKSDINLINIIKDFLKKTIDDVQIDFHKNQISARETYKILNNLKNKDSKFTPTHQVIDTHFKCKFLITKDKYIIPVSPSGIIIDLPTICFNMSNNNFDCFSKIKFKDLETTNKYLEEIYKLSDKKIITKPHGVFYDSIDKKGIINIIGVKTLNNDIVPVQQIKINKEELDKYKINYENRPLYYVIDQKLSTYTKDKYDFIDERIKNVNEQKYYNEGYQLFKFELSNIINNPKMKKYKDELKKYIDDKNYSNIQKLIKKICIDTKQLGNELVKIINEMPDLIHYNVDNQRVICSKLSENDCINNHHCYYNGKSKTDKNKCYFSLTENNLNKYVKKLSYEISEQKIKAYELLNEKKFYVSDIVDFNLFTQKPGQRIIKSSNTNLSTILKGIFGEAHIPKIGRRYLSKKTEIDISELQSYHPLKDIKNSYSQTIIPYNYSIMRAYINSYYWNKHSLYTIDSRNLGYYSPLQNELLNIFKSQMIDWLNVSDNIEMLNSVDNQTSKFLGNITQEKLDIKRVNLYVINLMENPIENNNGIFELFILNNIHKIKVILMINGEPKYQIDNKKISLIKITSDFSQYLNSSNLCINIDHGINNKTINMIESAYFK
jgi:hypothetical protein